MIFGKDPVSDPFFESQARFDSTTGLALRAVAGETIDTSLTALGLREAGRDLRGLGRLARGEQDIISAEDATDKYGIDGALSFDKPISADFAAEKREIKLRELARADILSRNTSTGLPARLSVGLVASFADPLGIAVSLIPGIGTEAKLAQTGKTLSGLTRFAARSRAGFREGLLGGAAVEAPISFLASQREGRDRTFGDALLNIVISGGLGAALRGVGGIGLDAARARKGASTTRPKTSEVRTEASGGFKSAEDLPEPVLPPEASSASPEARQAAFVSAVAEMADGVEVSAPAKVLDADLAAQGAKLDELGAPIKASFIREDIAIDPAGGQTKVSFAIVELNDLIASNTDDLVRNADFPSALQPRDRGRAASAAQIQSIAGDLKPELLGEAVQAETGAPVIAGDGVVESGNGRVLALRKVFAQAGEGEARYRAFLKSKNYPTDGFDQPVLVRVADPSRPGAERLRFARDANARSTAGFSVTEQALSDARALSPEIMQLHRGGEVSLGRNADFQRAVFETIVPENERASLTDAKGRISQDGVRRLEASIAAFAYDDAPLIAAVLETSDETVRGIGRALMDAAPAWAQLRAAVRSGDVPAGFDLTPDLLNAVHTVRLARRSSRNVAEFVRQRDMFDGDLREETAFFLRLFFKKEDYTGQRPAGKIAQDLDFLSGELQKAKAGPDLFGDTRNAPELSILKIIFDKRATGSLFDQGPVDGTPGASGRIGGDGAGSENLSGAGQTKSKQGVKSAKDGGPIDGDGDGIVNEKALQSDPELKTLIADDQNMDAQISALREQGVISKDDLKAIATAGLSAEESAALPELYRAAAFCLKNGGG
ncbi:MAG: hypothetical protein COA84_07540 [Robiginitomaculum sp.]|nr:MAG: hypothetical protein COA84_07540 [Robiginitomaculum sp.]